jgi:two-component system, LytTR family, response regulator
VTPVLRAMIVDDEAPAREGLRLRLKREPDIVVLGEFADARSALAAMQSDVPDVLFLDISMPGIDGFGLLDRLGDSLPPVVVFVTAHDEHAIQAFSVRAIDYLLKPVEQARLHETLERVREHLSRARRADVADRMEALLREVAEAGTSRGSEARPVEGGARRIPVRGANGAIQFIDPEDVDWIGSARDGVDLHVGKAKHHLNRTMGAALAMFDSRRFVRIHRSTVVNMDRVRELQPYFHGEYIVVLLDGTRLKLSRGQRGAVSQLLGSRDEERHS